MTIIISESARVPLRTRPLPPVDVRHNCGRLLFRVSGGFLYIRCPRCGKMHVFPLAESAGLDIDITELHDENTDID